jgi:hypothetical protein
LALEKPFPMFNLMQWITKSDANGENYAKVKGVPPQPLSLGGENVGKIYST